MPLYKQMKKQGHKKKIIEKMKQAGTYAESFDRTIEDLAFLLECRDDAIAQYKASGSHPVIIKTNRAHEKNLYRNPALDAILKIQETALSFYRELGLTPKGVKALGESFAQENTDPFSAMLAEFETEDEEKEVYRLSN